MNQDELFKTLKSPNEVTDKETRKQENEETSVTTTQQSRYEIEKDSTTLGNDTEMESMLKNLITIESKLLRIKHKAMM